MMERCSCASNSRAPSRGNPGRRGRSLVPQLLVAELAQTVVLPPVALVLAPVEVEEIGEEPSGLLLGGTEPQRQPERRRGASREVPGSPRAPSFCLSVESPETGEAGRVRAPAAIRAARFLSSQSRRARAERQSSLL